MLMKLVSCTKLYDFDVFNILFPSSYIRVHVIFICSAAYNPSFHNLNTKMSEERENRLILHWNYQGYSTLPLELLESKNTVSELYLKFNSIKKLVIHVYSLIAYLLLNFDLKFAAKLVSPDDKPDHHLPSVKLLDRTT